jgi:hypothetical protein
MRLENGFNLLFVLFRIEATRGNTFLEKHLDQVKKPRASRSILRILIFCKDFGQICGKMLTSCFRSRVLI